jgi:hypothetical protein
MAGCISHSVEDTSDVHSYISLHSIAVENNAQVVAQHFFLAPDTTFWRNIYFGTGHNILAQHLFWHRTQHFGTTFI